MMRRAAAFAAGLLYGLAREFALPLIALAVVILAVRFWL